MSNPFVPLPELTNAERACNIGDSLRLVREVELNGSWDNPTPTILAPSGQIYRVVNLFSRGWDLKRISGTGPEEIRVMNWDVRRYFDLLENARKS